MSLRKINTLTTLIFIIILCLLFSISKNPNNFNTNNDYNSISCNRIQVKEETDSLINNNEIVFILNASDTLTNTACLELETKFKTQESIELIINIKDKQGHKTIWTSRKITPKTIETWEKQSFCWYIPDYLRKANNEIHLSIFNKNKSKLNTRNFFGYTNRSNFTNLPLRKQRALYLKAQQPQTLDFSNGKIFSPPISFSKKDIKKLTLKRTINFNIIIDPIELNGPILFTVCYDYGEKVINRYYPIPTKTKNKTKWSFDSYFPTTSDSLKGISAYVWNRHRNKFMLTDLEILSL